MRALRVLVADPEPVFRAGLIQALSGIGRKTAFLEAPTAKRALALARAGADFAFIGAALPDLAAPVLGRRLRKAHPGCRVILIITEGDDCSWKWISDSGAHACVLRLSPMKAFSKIISDLLLGRPFSCPRDSAGCVRLCPAAGRSAMRPELTPRERQVLALILRGRTNRKIASQLKLSVRTVEAHRARIMAKKGARSVVELVRATQRKAGLDG